MKWEISILSGLVVDDGSRRGSAQCVCITRHFTREASYLSHCTVWLILPDCDISPPLMRDVENPANTIV